jgi:hypothetical protein
LFVCLFSYFMMLYQLLVLKIRHGLVDEWSDWIPCSPVCVCFLIFSWLWHCDVNFRIPCWFHTLY